MARKSNKTAHVLNLLAGHDSQKTPSDETASVPEVPSSSEPEAASAPAGQTVSVIDHTETDPVAELIADKLREEFGSEPEQTSDSHTTPEASVTEDTSIPEPSVTTVAQEPDETSDTTVVSEPDKASDTTVVSEPDKASDPAVVLEPAEPSDTAAILAAAETSDTVAASEPQPAPKPAAAAEPGTVSGPEIPEEPEFIALNLMERIVRDKIIYYMRQFDVCTCPRCVADTIALTLNGLPPKYIVTTPAAVDPLISFYTNKFIADITVEATKACITIKENPRH